MISFKLNDYEYNEIKRIRRELHKIPETGYKEHKTSNFVNNYLKKYGYEIEKTAGTGLIAVKKSTKNNPNNESIAFRADMDGLPIKEENNVDYKSTHQENMHACGHDGHTSMLLRFAAFTSRQKHLDKNLVFLFQPAEEGLGGAKKVLADGNLDKYNIKAMFATHMYPGADEGKVVIKPDTIMSQSTRINVNVKGKAAHGSMPHNGIDAINVAASLIQLYQSIISRKIDPNQMGVITVGQISGGDAANIIAENCNMKLTTRSHDEEVGDKIIDEIKNINKFHSKTTGASITEEVTQIYPPVVNDRELFKKVKEALGEDSLEIIKNPLPTAEDFSFYRKITPILFTLLGSRNEEKGFINSLHSNKFNFDEKVLLNGVENNIKIADKMGALKINSKENVSEFLCSIERRIEKLVKKHLKKNSLKFTIDNFSKIDLKVYVTNLFDEKDSEVKNLVSNFFTKSKYKDFIHVNNQVFKDNSLLKYNGIDSSHLIEVNINKSQKLTDFYSINKKIDKPKQIIERKTNVKELVPLI